MPAALGVGVAIWAASAYVAHTDHVSRLRETMKQRLQLRAAVSAERIGAVSDAVANAARNSITISAMAEKDVQRVVRPYLKSISFADTTTKRVALLDYRARLIVADRETEWAAPFGWGDAFERVTEGEMQSLLDRERLVLAAPVVLGSYVEGALVADISLASLFSEVEGDFTAEIVLIDLPEPRFEIWLEGSLWRGEVLWPVDQSQGIAVRLRKTMPGAGFWDNPVQKALVGVFATLIALTAGAIVLAAASVAAPVRKLVNDLARRGLEIDAPGSDTPAEISTLTNKFIGAAADVEQALLRERELTAQQSQFVSMVSHEFRTPLAIIDGAAGALLRRRSRMEDGAIVEKLNVITGAVTRLLRLMESTLSAARLDGDGFSIELKEMDLAALVERLVDERRSISPNIEVTTDVASLPKKICADERLITSVIDNLLSNAVKYGGSPAKVQVQGWSDGADAKLAVTDNGVGIPDDQLARIGERFFRASTSAGIIGTGVGLNMVKAVLQQHDGDLRVSSKLGEGSTFTIRLPQSPEKLASKQDCSKDTEMGSRDPDRQIWRTIYTSQAVESFNEEVLAALRNEASKKNGKFNITGALAYMDGKFAQVLEGPRDVVERLIETICRDPRHQNIKIVRQEAARTRAYREWRMNRIMAEDHSTPLEALHRDIEVRLQ
jgi:signal transduction histidine kinase